MTYIRPAIKEMSTMDLVLLHKGTIGSNDPSDIEFRMEVLEEMEERLKATTNKEEV